ncbi:hypothetical protein LTR10_023132 [Elasticomyces elasticus]|nr:hypothetical protein LTR10_023132 [Elasticomyces elasticus]KAK5039101.1 hypothetical protein LTR13_003356 [Exophiala sideris]
MSLLLLCLKSGADLHLRQAQTYYGLLKQGYKKHDIARYLSDYRKAAIGLSDQSSIDFRPVPSTFDLACRQVTESSEQDEETPQYSNQVTDQASNSKSTQLAASSLNPMARSFSDDYGHIERQELFETEDAGGQQSGSPVSLIPQMQVNRHAPRKSSLLRFAEAVSPERNSEQAPTSSPPRNGIKIYRRRSLTYPYRSSEVDAQALISTSQDSLIEEFDQMSVRETSTQSETDMQESDDMPFEFQPAFSSTSTSWAFYDDLVPPPWPDDQDPDVDQTPRRSSSLLRQRRPMVHLPSSPPRAVSPIDNLPQAGPSSTSPELPATPTPIRNATAYARTEPRHPRHHFLDGVSFSVYNDSLAASSQPQTPADLSRGRLVTQNDAAYTAPPGMVRGGSASVTNQDGNRWDGDAGEQSPTVRAINLRDRRNRELHRSVRAEGVRLQRLRMRDEAMFTQGTAAANPAAGRTGTGEGARGEMLQDIWRDDLDADRVGEENLEPELDATGPRTMRVVSGNTRFET